MPPCPATTCLASSSPQQGLHLADPHFSVFAKSTQPVRDWVCTPCVWMCINKLLKVSWKFLGVYQHSAVSDNVVYHGTGDNDPEFLVHLSLFINK